MGGIIVSELVVNLGLSFVKGLLGLVVFVISGLFLGFYLFVVVI